MAIQSGQSWNLGSTYALSRSRRKSLFSPYAIRLDRHYFVNHVFRRLHEIFFKNKRNSQKKSKSNITGRFPYVQFT